MSINLSLLILPAENMTIERESLLNVILIRTLRPERVLLAVEKYVQNVFNPISGTIVV